ncbi:reverse transcriptase domain-containing protein [Tanacetum coccineum]
MVIEANRVYFGFDGFFKGFNKVVCNAEINTRNQSTPLKNLETKIEQLTKELKSRTTNEALSSSTRQCRVVNADHEMPNIPISSRKLNNLHEVSFLSDSNSQVAQNNKEITTEVLQCKFLLKEQNPGNFTLPCTIGDFKYYAMTDLEASVNVMPRGIFEFLKLTNLWKTNMLIEMADMTKKAPLGVVENILVGIDKFLFPSDFVIINRTPNETIILGRPFLAIIHAKIHVFDKEISLGVGNDRISFDIEKKDHNFMIPTEKILMMNSISNNGPSCPPRNLFSKSFKTNNLQDKEERQVKKELRLEEYIPVKHLSKHVMQTYNGKVIDCFEEALDPNKDLMERSFDDYKWVFDLKIEQLANEYELGIRKKGHILEMIRENYKNIQGKAKEWLYDYWLEEDEKQENKDKKYDPPMVHLETFEITRYSFDNGNSFICVTNEIKDTLSLGRENVS